MLIKIVKFNETNNIIYKLLFELVIYSLNLYISNIYIT